MKKLSYKGDTIVEVILAMAILALVLFSAWSVTNRASQLSLAARQRIVMVNQLKEQAELIKSLNQTNPERVYEQFKRGTTPKPSANPCRDIIVERDDSENLKSSKLTDARIIQLDTATKELSFKPGSKLVGNDLTQRVWIQRDVSTATQGYIDFYVRGCWVITGGGQKLDNSQFVVRINV